MSDDLSADEWEVVQEELRGFLPDFHSTYEDPDSDSRVVAETEDYVVFGDAYGHEVNEIAEIADVDREALSRRMHEEARSLTDYNWSFMDPVVVYKPQGGEG